MCPHLLKEIAVTLSNYKFLAYGFFTCIFDHYTILMFHALLFNYVVVSVSYFVMHFTAVMHKIKNFPVHN